MFFVPQVSTTFYGTGATTLLLMSKAFSFDFPKLTARLPPMYFHLSSSASSHFFSQALFWVESALGAALNSECSLHSSCFHDTCDLSYLHLNVRGFFHSSPAIWQFLSWELIWKHKEFHILTIWHLRFFFSSSTRIRVKIFILISCA